MSNRLPDTDIIIHPELEVATFDSPEAFFTGMFGPAQHDAHVQAFNGHRWLVEKRAENALRFAAVQELADEIIARERARRMKAELMSRHDAAIDALKTAAE